MHELAVTEGILKTALAATEQNGARAITAIDLVIGELSSIMDDSVQFHFDALSQGTLAEGATLRFRRISATAHCGNCDRQFPVKAPLDPCCPACGSTRLHITGGKEFYVESIEVTDEHSCS